MDYYITRAMQAICLDEAQLAKLHEIEDQRGYCLPNHNIQEFFGLQTLKDQYALPEEEMILREHEARMKKDLKDRRIYSATDAGWPSDVNPEATHIWDKRIHEVRFNLEWTCASTNKYGSLRKAVLGGSRAVGM